jgi:cAMP-binding proteins - catabolite gene activator and regulatory subunit of cAMP-dependent protein kinases
MTTSKTFASRPPTSADGHAAHASQHRNRLLRTITSSGYANFDARLERVDVSVRDVLAKQGDTFTHAWFPETCVISLVNRMSDGSTVEVGTIGNEGFAGLPAYLEADASESDTFCQIPGTALRLPIQDLIDAASTSVPLRKLVGRYTQSYLTQVAQSAACNRVHDIEQRCARWLLMTHDRVDGASEFVLKQEFLAFMLGVRRAGVTEAAGHLQERGLIRYRRGTIAIVDRPGLEAAACECYAIVRRQFDRLLPS